MSRQSIEHRQPLLLEPIIHGSLDTEYSFDIPEKKPERHWRLSALIVISVLSLLLNTAQFLASARATRLCNRSNSQQLYSE